MPATTIQKSVHIHIHFSVKNRRLSYLLIHSPWWCIIKQRKGKRGNTVKIHFHSTTSSSLQMQINTLFINAQCVGSDLIVRLSESQQGDGHY